MPRRSEPDPPQGLNHSYYHPDEPVDSSYQEPSSSSRRSKPEKSRRNRSPGDDYKPRHSSRRDPSPGYNDKMPYRSRRYPSPPPFAAPTPPPQEPYRSSNRDYNIYPPRDSPRESQRGSQRDAPRDSRYRGDDDRRPRDYPSGPRERRHKSSRREPSPEQPRRSRNISPDPRSRSTRSYPTDDPRSSRRSRGAPAPASDDERDRRHRSHRSQPREAEASHGRSRDLDRTRDRDRAPADSGRSSLKRRSTMPAVSSSGTRSKGASNGAASWWKNPAIQAGARTALAAGAQAFMQNRKEAGPWLGAKGAKVATVAITAALADGFGGKDKKRR
ncbi:hypothetical protein GGI43DRAFT_384331 [Trichoderma evansii]